MKIDVEAHNKKKAILKGMEEERQAWWPHWRELADFYLPRRYVWLQTPQERVRKVVKNPNILDGTGTTAARILAAGMMNGITSPGRPWFRLRIPGLEDQIGSPERVWLDEVTRRMMLVLAESNFYNALAVMYLDLVVFGTAAMIIYEDSESVIRCYNPALGEFYIAQDYRLQVNTFAREFTYKVHQVVAMFGEENCSETVRSAYREKGSRLMEDVKIVHLIEPNLPGANGYEVPRVFPYRECYWEAGVTGELLALRGFHEFPCICPRWELSGNDSYGSSPAMDALGDVIQLQHETKKKGQGLDKMVNPPVIADIQLKHKPTALLPNGVTFVAGINNVGVKPAYTVQLPLQELTLDIREVQARIRETFHNDLFQMISQLDTVRSATEIDARREEKLVRLGSVLERFENEALDPALRRVFSIMNRARLLPEPPESLAGLDIEIQYVSILSTAQSALSVIPTERFIGLVGNIAAMYPKAVNVPNWEELLRDYGQAIGVPAKSINPPDVSQALNQQMDEILATREAANTGAVAVEAAKNLSETEVGGGANALQRLLGG